MLAGRYTMLLSFILLLAAVHAAEAASPVSPTSEIVVKHSPESKYETRIKLADNELARLIAKGGLRRTSASLPATDVELIVYAAGTASEYAADEHGRLYDAELKQLLELPPGQRLRLGEAVRAARASHYGQLLPWDKARKLIPKRATLTVTDVESGLSFQAQNRAGARHVDAQPLTAADTAIMRRMYGGAWSWKRRAVIVSAGSYRLAASMHGMPHGGDGIPGNKFAGHFCIHFLGSRTHGSGLVDPEHRLMVYKAAGQLQQLFVAAEPETVVRTFIAAVSMEERQLAAAAFTEAGHRQLDFFFRLRRLDVLAGKRTARLQAQSDLFTATVPLEINVQQGRSRSSKLVFTFHLKRSAVYDPWKIELVTLVGREQPR